MVKEKDNNWYNGSLIKVFLQNKRLVLNKDTIDNYIEHFRNQILPHKGFMNDVHNEVIDELIRIKNKYNW